MSYSFSIRASTKALAKAMVADRMAAVVASQACHAVDLQQALVTSSSVIDLLPEDVEREVAVSVSGYVSGTWDGTSLVRLSGVSLTVGASLVDRAGD